MSDRGERALDPADTEVPAADVEAVARHAEGSRAVAAVRGEAG